MSPSPLHARTLIRTPLRSALVALLVALGIVALGAAPATAASDEVSWAVRTASNDFGADRQNFSYTLDPAGRLKDAMVVANHGKKPLTLAVSAADGFTTDSGQLDLATADKKPVGVGAWLHPGKRSVTIPAGKSVEVPFTVTLPANATPGDHVGGIITSLTQSDEAAGINVDRRLAIRVRLRVGGELEPKLSVEDLHVDYDGTANPFGSGDATVTYTIHNTGNAILTARQAASVSGPFGILRVDADTIPDSPELIPGDTWKVEAQVSGVVPALRLAGTVSLTPLLTDATGSLAPLATVDATTHGWAVPWSLLLVLILVAVLAVAAVRARRLAKVREEVRVQGAVAEALRERETADH